MTPEQLDEIEKLAEAWRDAEKRSDTRGDIEAKLHQFIRAMREYALPLVKALREARAALEWQAAMTKALSESQERLAQEVKEARAEVERLRAAVQQVHAMSVTEERDYRCVRVVENLREIHKLTKEEP